SGRPGAGVLAARRGTGVAHPGAVARGVLGEPAAEPQLAALGGRFGRGAACDLPPGVACLRGTLPARADTGDAADLRVARPPWPRPDPPTGAFTSDTAAWGLPRGQPHVPR